ncbi:MAG TPA: polysaccharide pyruvyl transferase family protein [Polyangiaceae bacterium]
MYSVALLSPCGWGNLGDAAIVESTIHAVRTRLPEANIVGLTLNPEDTATRHGIPTYTCVGFQRPHYAVSVHAPFAEPVPAAELRPVDAPPANGPRARLAGLRHRLRGVALGRAALKVFSAVKAVPAEVRHRQYLAESMHDLRYVVVTGGGQLDDFWGGAWGHPYVIFRWMQHARSLGAKGLVLSVGTGSLTTPLARYFIHRALALADYRSFRDEGSRALVKHALVANDPVVPDLAFGLPVPERARPSAIERGTNPLIAISPIAYCDPEQWPEADETRYRSYLERLSEFCVALLDAGFDLVLYGTDRPDLHTVEVLRAELERRTSPERMKRVHTPRVRTLSEMFAALADAELLVASRLHGILLAQLFGIPSLALSYERKVSTLMTTLGHQGFCVPIETFGVADALARFHTLYAERHARVEELRRAAAGFSEQVNRQFDRVFGPRPDATSREELRP